MHDIQLQTLLNTVGRFKGGTRHILVYGFPHEHQERRYLTTLRNTFKRVRNATSSKREHQTLVVIAH